jgi:hypothetical protein
MPVRINSTLTESFLTSNTFDPATEGDGQNRIKKFEKVTSVDGDELKNLILYDWIVGLHNVLVYSFGAKIILPKFLDIKRYAGIFEKEMKGLLEVSGLKQTINAMISRRLKKVIFLLFLSKVLHL